MFTRARLLLGVGRTHSSIFPRHKPRTIAYYLLSSSALARRPRQDGFHENGNMTERPRTKASQRLIWFVLAALVPLVPAFIACGSSESQARLAPKGPNAVRVEVASIQRISVQRQVELAGTLVSPDQARVSSEVAGIVREVLVELGHEVKPGQVLVKLEPRELELALRQSEGLLRQTEAQLGMDGSLRSNPPPDEEISIIRTAVANRDDARAQAARASQLLRQGLLTQADYDTTQTRLKVTDAAYQAALEQVRSLKATLQQRRAAVELAQKKLGDAVIRAPIDGSVAERLVQPGEFIRENTPVVTIVQVNPLKLKTAIQEKYAALVHPGLAAEFNVESVPNEVFRGRIAYVSPSVDQATRTFPVEILVDNGDRRLKPGFFAQGSILTKTDQNVLAVPEAAISTLAGESSVFVVENNRVKKQQVVLGAHADNLIEIVTGLKGDETLATTNLNELADGVVVVTGKRGAAPASEGGTAPEEGRRGRPDRGKRGGQS
jgi:multidrug efflux pump subunit AcrA (membrane-fusion protein)